MLRVDYVRLLTELEKVRQTKSGLEEKIEVAQSKLRFKGETTNKPMKKGNGI